MQCTLSGRAHVGVNAIHSVTVNAVHSVTRPSAGEDTLHSLAHHSLTTQSNTLSHVGVNAVHSYMNRESNRNLSGDEIYYAACSFLVTLKNSCSKLYCQKGFNSVPFSYKIATRRPRKPLLIGRLPSGLNRREIGNLLPNNRRQRRTCYAFCHIPYPVSAAHMSIFRNNSNSTSYRSNWRERGQGLPAVL